MNEVDPEKEALLNSLKEEYNTILQKKPIMKEHDKLIKEIYINIKNRIHTDPFIIDKLKLKTPLKQGGDSKCCSIF